MKYHHQKDFFKKVLKKIVDHQEIILLGHVSPDGDCIGAQLAFFYALKIKYPHKKIYAPFITNKDYNFLLPKYYDQNLPKNLQNSLYIIFDANNYSRLPLKITSDVPQIWIDHHTKSLLSLELYWSDPQSASTCEMLYHLMNFLNLPFNEKISNCLISGIITDSGNFSFSRVNKETFLMCASLIERGANFPLVQENLNRKNKNTFKIINFISENLKFEDHFAFLSSRIYDSKIIDLITNLEDLKKHLFFFTNIENINIYAFFLQLKENDFVHVSLRSKEINLLDVAKKFGGGGHPRACGIRLKSWEKVSKLINDLKILSKKNE